MKLSGNFLKLQVKQKKRYSILHFFNIPCIAE